jgi:NADH-quinone oxidoreductase subunit E
MDLSFTQDNDRRLRSLLDSYPTRQACLLPALQLAQEQFGYLSHEVMLLVAERLELSPASVFSTATFYTLFNKRPVGRHHIQVCGNVSCFLRGGDAVLAALEQELGIKAGQTTADGRFTLSVVQCLASCGTAPSLQVNDSTHEEMTGEKAVALVRKLREEKP